MALNQNVYATHERSSGSRAKEGCATVTVHGDGVHVFDVRFFPNSSVFTRPNLLEFLLRYQTCIFLALIHSAHRRYLLVPLSLVS